MKITSTIKGLITAGIMIGIFLGIYYGGNETDSRFQYGVYLVYAAGIAWTLLSFRVGTGGGLSFGQLFNQGFKCFIVVTLLVSLFYGIFNYSHPEFATESAAAYRKELVKANDNSPVEIDSKVADYKKQYTLRLVSGAIFGYLIIGAAVTLILSVLLASTKRTN